VFLLLFKTLMSGIFAVTRLTVGNGVKIFSVQYNVRI